MICFSQTVLQKCQFILVDSNKNRLYVPVIEEAHGHWIFVFVFYYFAMLSRIRIALSSVGA